MKRNYRPTLSYTLLRLLCVFLGIILGVMLCATFAFQSLMNQMDLPQPEPPTAGAILTKLSALTQAPDPNTIGGNGSPLVNILLIGQDRREGESGQTRSDTMILCSFNKDTDTITMTSFLRDLYVPIPGQGSNRINAAYSAGGRTLLKQTLEQNFDLHIDGCVEVDFAQFKNIIDVIGGIPLELRADEASFINQASGFTTLEPGLQHLYGEEALIYARIRNLDTDGDFSRTNRQRKLITALVNQVRQLSLSKFVPLLGELLPMISTDLNQGQLLLLGIELLPHLSGARIQSQRIPADGTYQDQTIGGMSVLVADMAQARALLRSTLTEE